MSGSETMAPLCLATELEHHKGELRQKTRYPVYRIEVYTGLNNDQYHFKVYLRYVIL